jgi:hypothetical protein
MARDRVEDNLKPVGRWLNHGLYAELDVAGSWRRSRCAGWRARLREVITQGGFPNVRRATETPFNMVVEESEEEGMHRDCSDAMSTGRNFDEVLRLLDSCQLTTKHSVATLVNWKPGDDVIIPPAVSNQQAVAKYPNGWKTLKPYLRIVAQPGN